MNEYDIFEKYTAVYGSNLQGCCLLIADEIVNAIGGDVVAGSLTWFGGTCSRSHWWVEKDGRTIDPMGDDILGYEEATGRIEVHRNRAIFDSLLPNYERWRVGSRYMPPEAMDNYCTPCEHCDGDGYQWWLA